MKMKNFIQIFIISCLTSVVSNLTAQVGIGTPTPHNSAILDLSGSASRGFRLPEVNLSSPPATPAKGLMVWNTNGSYGSGEGIYYYDGSAWQKMTIGVGADNLGNHTATQNIRLNSNWLSNDGDNEGIFIDNTGRVDISGTPATRLDLRSATTDNKPLLKLHPGTATGIDFNGFAHHDFLLGSYSTGGYSQHYISFGYTSDPNRKFHIGSANSADFSSASFVPALTILSGTKVGINTPSPDANFEVTGSMKVLGTRLALALGTVYGPAATDGFVFVSGRHDGAGGVMSVQVNVDTSNPPATDRGKGYSYNNGVTYLGSVQLTVPVRKGEYYRILCNGGATCGGSSFIGEYNAYFTPFGQ